MEEGVNVGGTDGGDGGEKRKMESKWFALHSLQARENLAILRELALA